MKRILLNEHADRAVMDAAIRQHGWKLLDIRRERDTCEIVCSTPDGRFTIHYVDDRRLRARYVVLPDRDAAALELEVRGSFDAIADDTILAGARVAAEPERVRALYRLTVIAAAHRAEITPLLELGATDACPAVRVAAIEAAFTIGWPELEPLIERAAREESEPAIRQHAASLLESQRAR